MTLRPLTWPELWAFIWLLWAIILGVIWLVRWLARSYPSTIVVGRFESKAEAEKWVKEFEAALERDKDKARNFLHRSTM